jgi:hypothetical protein
LIAQRVCCIEEPVAWGAQPLQVSPHRGGFGIADFSVMRQARAQVGPAVLEHEVRFRKGELNLRRYRVGTARFGTSRRRVEHHYVHDRHGCLRRSPSLRWDTQQPNRIEDDGESGSQLTKARVFLGTPKWRETSHQ